MSTMLLGIALALQGTLANLAAGVMLLLFRPFKIGDSVELGGKAGRVRSLSLFVTELVNADNVQVLLPNGSVWGQAILNRSAYPGVGKIEVSFPVRAGEPAQAMSRALMSVLDADPRTNAKPSARISKVVDLSDPDAGVVELTVGIEVAPEHADGVRTALFEAANAFVARARHRPMAALTPA